MPQGLHVIFGAGQVGTPLAARLLREGKRVRVARRSSRPGAEGAEVMSGDAADPAFCRQAATGAATVYHCMNPAEYSAKVWAELVPRYMENLIAAAGAARARLVVLDNLYMLGKPGGKPLDEDTPMNPCSKKGEVRARAAQRLFEAHRGGDVRAVTGRASDYYGPGGTATHLGDPFWPNVVQGKTTRVVLDPDAVHTYHYIPDVVAGLATLGSAPDEDYGGTWMLPCASAESLDALAARFSRILGRKIRLAEVPRWVMRAAGLFVPFIREVNEMRYQWDEPFVVDDRRFRERFEVLPVDRERAAEATVAWAREHYQTR